MSQTGDTPAEDSEDRHGAAPARVQGTEPANAGTGTQGLAAPGDRIAGRANDRPEGRPKRLHSSK